MERREILEQSDFKKELAGIVSTPLSAENIDTYADEALTQLVGLIENTVAEFKARPIIAQSTERDYEEASFGYFGLQNIEAILDHIADKADETHSLDAYIASIPRMVDTILPAGQVETPIVKGDTESTFEKRELPRLKTLLFVLSNRFETNLANTDEVIITKGTNEPTMVRSQSYYSVELPQLERHILINDEVGNVTYILNSMAYSEGSMTSDDITSATKQELNGILETHPTYGKRVIYNDNFVANLIAAIEDPSTSSTPERRSKEEALFLLPEIPAGYMTLKEAAASIGVGTLVVKRTLSEIETELGEVSDFRLKRGQIVKILSEEQVQRIKEYIENNTQYGRRPPEGYLSNVGLAKMYGFSFQTIYKVTSEMQSLGLIDPETYLFSTTLTLGYSPGEQETIKGYLDANEYFVGAAPEGYLSMSGLRGLFGGDRRGNPSFFKRAIADLGDEFGPIERYRFGQKVTDGFSPSQVEKIMDRLKAVGIVAPSPHEITNENQNLVMNAPPEGYLSALATARKFDVSFATIKRIISGNSDVIGTINVYAHKGGPTQYYSPEQQDFIHLKMQEAGYFTETAPEGYVTLSQLKARWNVWERLIRRELNAHKEEIGEPTIYKVGSRAEETYNEQQQALLESYVREAGLIAPTPPYGTLSRGNLLEQWGVEMTIFNKAVQRASLGDVESYKFRNHIVPGYDADQQEKIHSQLESLGAFVPTMPDDYRTKKMFSEEMNSGIHKIERIMRELGLTGERMKFNYQVTVCLSPGEQQIIKENW